MIVGDIDGYQTRFRAWLRFLGAQTGDSVVLHEYVIWIMYKGSEFKHEYNFSSISTDSISNEFTAWLHAKADEANTIRDTAA